MTMTQYFIGAWFTAAMLAAAECEQPTANIGTWGNVLTSLLATLLWPIVAVIVLGKIIRWLVLR